MVGPLRGGTLQEEEISGELGFKIFIVDPPHMFPMCQDVNKQLPKTLPTEWLVSHNQQNKLLSPKVSPFQVFVHKLEECP